MALAQSIRAGSAFVELSTKDGKLQRGLRRAQAKLRAFASSIQNIGAKLVSVGTLSAVPFALSVKSFADFESAMARVLALTNAAPDEFERLKEEAKRLGATTAFSATQAGEAMSFFAQAGFSVNEILAATGPTLDLAATGQLELAEAADITTKILRGMGISTDELSNVVDVLAKAMTTANTDLQMLGEAFKFVGPIAKTAGVKFEEITAAIQVLSDAGIQGEMAGTTLRGMIISLTSPSAEAKKELDRLGVSIKDNQGNFRSLAEIIKDLETAMAGMGTAQRLESLGTIFPARQAAGAAEFVATGSQKLIEAMERLEDSSGTAGRVAATQMNTLKGAVLILKSALEGLAITIGEALAPVLREWGSVILLATGAVNEWAKRNKQLFQTIAKVLLAVVVIGGALISFGLAIKLVAFALGGIGAAISLVGTLLSALLSPIGLVVAAIAGIGVWFVRSTETGQRAMASLTEGFRQMGQFFGKTWQGIVDALRAGDLALAGKIAWASLKVIWQQGVLWLEDKWIGFKNFFIDIFQRAVFGIARFLNDAWANIQIAWAETIAFLQRTWSKFTHAIEFTWTDVTGKIEIGWEAMKAQLSGEDPLQSAAVKQRVEELVKERNRIINEFKADVGNIEQRRQARRQGIEGERAGIEQQLNQMQAQERADREMHRQRVNKEAQDQLDAALGEWQDAIGEAARKRAEKEAAGAGLPGALEKHAEGLSSVSTGTAAAVAKADVAGTFNAFALRGMGSDSLRDKELHQLGEINQGVKKLVREAQNGGLVFA